MAKKIVLGFGIAIVFAALTHYGICTFFPKPKWEDYKVPNYYERHKRASNEEKIALEKEKNEKEELRKKDQQEWATKYFYIGLPIGILAVIIGAFIKLPAIGSGLLAGGILVLIESYGHYWLHMPDAPKFVSLIIVFILLLWVGYKKVEKT